MAAPLLARADDSLLLLVDLQDKLLAGIVRDTRQSLLQHAGILAQAARLLDVPVLGTEQYPEGLGTTAAALRAHLPTAPVAKTRFSCCGVEAVDQAFAAEQRRCVVIAGVEAHICVLQTALHLLEQGYAPFVVEDAVASRSPAHKRNALARLRQAGVIVSNLESVLFEWLGDARHPAFKAVSALIR
ncbi:isochorismatase family protein [Thermithiobacillus tepidarius DSM 3134]|uniref:isochorismatase family protein n=1 Tax=Thermithiobacillus tepidarius TaxID=929 RepID=UPI0004132CC4|nr:isochorismatase family protein [Thermithiobacillus tepidarius]